MGGTYQILARKFCTVVKRYATFHHIHKVTKQLETERFVLPSERVCDLAKFLALFF
jgi:hypothetical protein